MSEQSLQSGLMILSLCLLIPSGCAEEQTGIDRVKTVPISGNIQIDGKPANYVAVRAVPADGQPSKAIISSSAFTDPEGNFAIGTYEKGDGAPPGEYKLTFVWGDYNLFSGQYSGDKFKGKYADPAKSEITVSVPDSDEPVDLGTIELTTEGS